MISLNKRFPKNDAIWIYSNPKIAQQKAFEYYGSDDFYIEVIQKIKSIIS